MAESYNAIAIKMGIDTSQFDAGLRRTQKQIDDVAARMAKASEENRQRASMAAGMAGMVTPEDRRLSEQIAIRLKINQIINQQNQLLEQNRARQQAINAETERYNRVTSTLLVNMIRRTEQEAIDNRQLAVNIAAKLKLIQITDSERAALERSREAAQQWTEQVINATNAQRAFAATKSRDSIQAREAEGMAFSQALQARMQAEQLEKEQLELANAKERDRQLSKEIQTRLTLNTIRNQQNSLLEEEARLESAADARAELRRMFTQEEEKTNALLAFQNQQRRELLALQKQLDAAGIQGNRRKRLIADYQALQAATKAEWEKGNAQKYTTELERKAEAVKDRLITAEQRHAATLVDLKSMLQQNLLTQKQYAAAVQMTNNALAMQQGGMSRMAGVMAQASFAVEDFSQVLLMGGGLNMALMSASNNITYLLHTSGMITSVWGTLGISAIPLVLSGVNRLVQSMQKQHQTFEDWSSELNDYFRVAGRLIDEHNDKVAHARRLEDIDVSSVSSSERAGEELDRNTKEQIRLQEDLANARQIQAGVARRVMQEEETFLSKRNSEQRRLIALLRRSNEFDNEAVNEGIARREEQFKQEQLLIEASRKKLELDLASATSAEEYRQAWMNYGSSISTITGKAAEEERKRINNMLNNADQLQDSMNNQLKINRDIEASFETIIALQGRRSELEVEEEKARENQLRWMKATREERALMDLHRQQEQFVGLTLKDIAEDPRAAFKLADERTKDFLLAAQKETQNRIDELQKTVEPAFSGALQQDAFKAQAEAFRQMDQARQEKRNPQLDEQIGILRKINEALSKGRPLVIAGGK